MASRDTAELPGEARWLTLANGVSGLRLLCVAPCAWAVVAGLPVLAAALFAFAVATDFVDGPLARRRGEVSWLGGLLDHAIDATFVTFVLAALATRGEVPALLPALVAAAFLQYVLDSRALAGRRLRASALGRWNGILYFVLAGTPIVRDVLGLARPGAAWVGVLGWLLVVSTAISMADRARALLSRP